MNTNCLAGLRCPGFTCKSFGPFRIVSTCWTDWTDDGSGDSEGFEFGDRATCICMNCGISKQVKDFREGDDGKT